MIPSLRIRRAAFLAFALLLFTATHWPNLQIAHEAGRPDLLAHASTFGAWTLLLVAAAFFGPALSLRNVLACAAVAGAYAALDEASQALPFLNRTAAWDDLGANLIGVGLASLMAFSVASVRAGHRRASPESG